MSVKPEEALSKSDLIYNQKRLVMISQALHKMEIQAKTFLDEFESSNDYKIYRIAFRQFQFSHKLKDFVKFQVCNLADRETSYYRTKQITICYNKINNYDHFKKLMKYNLTLLYDEVRANINWSDCSQLACMKIRGLNISQLCRNGDKECIKNEILEQLEKTETCKGKFEEYFENSYKQCILDIAPINSVQSAKQTLFF